MMGQHGDNLLQIDIYISPPTLKTVETWYYRAFSKVQEAFGDSSDCDFKRCNGLDIFEAISSLVTMQKKLKPRQQWTGVRIAGIIVSDSLIQESWSQPDNSQGNKVSPDDITRCGFNISLVASIMWAQARQMFCQD